MKNTNLTKQNFRFFVAQDEEFNFNKVLQHFIDGILNLREWVIAPPSVIKSDENPTNLVGGELEIYSALNQKLPFEIDNKHLEEVELVIDGLKEISKKYDMDFELYLDNVFVGEINKGKSDKLLQEGLIDEWKKVLLSEYKGHI